MESYATVDQIVRSALIDLGNISLHHYPRFLNWALDCVQDWNMDSAKEVKTVKLTMNDIKQVELPRDFVDWVKVGIQCGDRIKIMGVREDMNRLHNTDDCGNPKPFDNCNCTANTLPPDYTLFGGYYFFDYRNDYGEFTGGLYGYGGGYNQNGYFQVDRTNGVLQFTSDVNNTNIYLEYISTGFNPNQQSVVNQYARKCIKWYVHWMYYTFSKGAASGDAQKWELLYREELHNARFRLMDLTIEDIIGLSRQSYGQSPKQ